MSSSTSDRTFSAAVATALLRTPFHNGDCDGALDQPRFMYQLSNSGYGLIKNVDFAPVDVLLGAPGRILRSISGKRWYVKQYFVAGGAGFIGSHLVRRILQRSDAEVTAFDNFSSGTKEHLADVIHDRRLRLIEGDLRELESLRKQLEGVDHVYHFAANPDIAKAETDPGIDFRDGTYLTHNLLEASRLNGVTRLTYASGSGVYGDMGTEAVTESAGPLCPVSTYGASKLGCEALLSSYCHMFGMHGVAFRFANVVGPRQTHGVGYDFVRGLLKDSSRLRILGDGSQSKSYIHVDDVVSAMLLLEDRSFEGFDIYNVSTDDYTTVREIADMVVAGLELTDVEYCFTGGERGWRGDVPIVRFNSEKIRQLGWCNTMTSAEALESSIESMIGEAKAEREEIGSATS